MEQIDRNPPSGAPIDVNRSMIDCRSFVIFIWIDYQLSKQHRHHNNEKFLVIVGEHKSSMRGELISDKRMLVFAIIQYPAITQKSYVCVHNIFFLKETFESLGNFNWIIVRRRKNSMEFFLCFFFLIDQMRTQ